MFGTRTPRQHLGGAMWETIYETVGSIGLLARSTADADNGQGEIVGQMIYMPKPYAQRICMPRGACLDNQETTMVVCCLKADIKNQGIASAMIREAIAFCRSRKFTRMEAFVDPRSPDETARWVPSYYPYRKYGFQLEGTATAWEGKPDSRICYLTL
jgi:GNAT superfamily N-acetyltransferase